MDTDPGTETSRGRRLDLRDPSKSLLSRLKGWRRLTMVAFALVALSLVALVVANEAIYGPHLRDAVDASRSSRIAHEAMLDQETGLRSYATTGDEQFLEPYERGRRALPALNSETAELVRDDPDASTLLFEVRLAQAAWTEAWTEEALQAGRSGGLDGPEAQQLLDEGKALFDDYRAAQDDLIAELMDERNAAFGAQSSAIFRTAGLALAITVLFGLVSIWRVRALRRSLVPALQGVEDHLVRIRDGDLSTGHAFVGPAELQAIDSGLDDTALALASARAQAEEHAQRVATQNRQLAQVLGLAREIAGSLSMRYILRGVSTAAAGIADGRRAVVWVSDGEEPRVIARADSAGPGMEPVGLEPVALGEGVVGRAARYGRVEGHRAGLLESVGTLSTDEEGIAVPMVVGAEVIGVLQIIGQGVVDLPSDTLNVLEALAVQAATAVGSARLHEHTETLAMTDALTHLPNRRRLEVDLAREVAVSVRYERPLAFAMIDVDHFKAYNDSLGHQAGDVALQELAGVLSRSIRGGDTIYRYGGEEISIVMRETDLDGAARQAERLRAAVEHHFSGPGHQRAVTISAGVAALPTHGRTGDALVAAADQALYDAKRSGRNRVGVAASSEAALAD